MRGAVLGLVVLTTGCIGSSMGWGINGTTFDVKPREGLIEVTEVGQGAQIPVSPGESPRYNGEKTRWDEFALRFEDNGTHIAFGRPAERTNPALPAGQPFPLTNVASGEVRLHDRLYFCHETAPVATHRFAVVIRETPGSDYNMQFERMAAC